LVQSEDGSEELMFGQDRIPTVLDLVAGWKAPPLQTGVWPVKQLDASSSKL
jgi:hypothetical protein